MTTSLSVTEVQVSDQTTTAPQTKVYVIEPSVAVRRHPEWSWTCGHRQVSL